MLAFTGIIEWLRRKHRNAIVADMGCGEGRLGLTLASSHTVHSFDLVSAHPHITAADIAHVPLDNESVDVVVFCLSLMGTNIGKFSCLVLWSVLTVCAILGDFLQEANRILKKGGVLKIVEVRSRFEKEAEGVKKFIRTVKKLGFNDTNHTENQASTSHSNKMFFELECVKIADATTAVPYSAGACVYKKR